MSPGERSVLGKRKFSVHGIASRLGTVALQLLLTALLLSGMIQASDLTQLQKPAPDARQQPSEEWLTAFIRMRYPELPGGRIAGTSVVVVLFNPDGSLVRSTLLPTAPTPSTVTATEFLFRGFGLRSEELRDVGEMSVQVSEVTVLVVLGTRSDAILDRELVGQYFPQALSSGVSGDESLWILFDYRGYVRKYGTDRVSSVDLRDLLEQRYPGIHIAQATVAPVMGRGGKPPHDLKDQTLELNCLWLTADSPAPPQ
jgi:hypothetical protein